MSANFRLKVTKIIGQRTAFYRQGIQESSHVRKETVGKFSKVGQIYNYKRAT